MKNMKWVDLESSNFKKNLYVEFNSGDKYIYADVEYLVYEAIIFKNIVPR